MTGQNIAYIRVSSEEQNQARQLEALANINVHRKFIEKVSAKDTNRPQLQAMLGHIREGDTVYINDFSRLARSTKDLLELVETFNYKGVKLISLKEDFNTSTANGRLMLTMLGAINQFERENLKERQMEGIRIAQKQGKYKGRKKINHPENWEKIYTQWKQREITAAKAMQELNLKRNTFYNLLKDWESTANKG